jgi:carboxymethylenebutenolidase
MESNLELSRRSFVRTGLAAGFALAVQPIAEATIHTDDAGLVAGEVQIKGADGFTFPAYQAYPVKHGKTFPVVVVIHEIFGVHEHIKDVCRRFAKRGYLAIAPELFARQGDVSKVPDVQSIIQTVVSKVPDAQVASDLDAVVAFVKTEGKADVRRLAVCGFCWGGRQAWLYCAHNPAVKAGGAWYGPLGGTPNPLQPKTVPEAVVDLTVPVLGQYGGQDRSIPESALAELRGILAKGKSGSEIVVYPDAGHGFNADYRPSYNEKDAKAAFTRLLGWYRAHGVG